MYFLLFLIIIILFYLGLLLLLRKKMTLKYLIIFNLFFVVASIIGSSTYAYFINKNKDKDNDIQVSLPAVKEVHDNFIIKIKESVLIDAPIIDQFPELPRGCEVTSLAMLLQHLNIDVDKMTLAEEIHKNPAQYRRENGKIYFGHPNFGFIGNMYTYEKPGLGVYHKPIRDLAEDYIPGRVLDLTGSDFEELKIYLSDDRPVWVIINTAYDRLPNSYFQTWQTDHGEIEITYKEHSVLVTGYDNKYVYFNDPLIAKKNRKEPIEGFKRAWEQMGSQAITYTEE